MVGITIGQLMVKLGMDIDEFTQGFKDAQSELKRQASQFESTGLALSTAITAPLAAIAAFSVKAFSGFESAMNKVLALGGSELAPMFDQLSKQALQLGADTIFSAKQAADGMGELAAAGFKAQEIFQAMPGLLSLAATESMSLGNAAAIASGILKGFGIAASEMQKVADILAVTASASAVSVADLGNSFQYVGPVAKAAGQSFLDVAAALGVLGNAGIRGETGGTALRNLFNDLLTPSKQVAGAMRDLGINVLDSSGKMKPLQVVIKELAPLTSNLALGFKLFGQRFSDVLPLISDGGVAFESMRKEIEKFDGAADAMAKTMMKGLSGQFETFSGGVETLAITIGKILAPAVSFLLDLANKAVDTAQRWADAFLTLPKSVQNVTVAVVALAAAIGPTLLGIGLFMKGIAALELGPGFLTALSGGLKVFGNALIDTTGTVAKLRGILMGLAETSGFTTLATSARSTGSAIVNAFKSIPSVISSSRVALVEFGATLGTAVVSNLKALPGLVTAAAGSFATLARVNAAGAITAVTTALAGLGATLRGVTLSGAMAALASAATGLGAALSAGLSGAISGVGAALGALTAPLVVGTAAFAALAAAVAGAAYFIVTNWDELVKVFQALMLDIQNAINKAGQFVARVATTILGSDTVNVIARVWSGLTKFFADMWASILSGFRSAGVQLATFLGNAAEMAGATNTANAFFAWAGRITDSLKGIDAQAKKTSIVPAADLSQINASVGALNAMVDKYTSGVRLGTMAWGEASAKVNEVGALQVKLLGQRQELNKLLKEGKISQEQFARATGDIDKALASASSFAFQMTKDFGASGNALGGAKGNAEGLKKVVAETKRQAELLNDTIDKTLDITEDIPRSFAKFSQAMQEGGFNAGQAIKRLSEEWRDLERKISNETNPKLIAALKGQALGIDLARRQLLEYQKQWEDQKISLEILKISAAIDDIAGQNAMKMVLPDFLDGIKQGQMEVDKLEDAFQRLGLTFDETAAKSGGQFTQVAAEADRALEAYQMIAASGLATTEQLQKAWMVYLEKRTAADRDAADRMRQNATGLFQFISAGAATSAAEIQLSVLKATNAFKETLAKDLGGVFTNLFKFDSKGLLSSLELLGKDFLKGTKELFFAPFETQLQNFVKNLSTGVSDFISKQVIGVLGKGLDAVFSKGTAVQGLFTKIFGGGGLADAGKSAISAAEAAGAAAKVAAESGKLAVNTANAAKAASETVTTAASTAQQATRSALSMISGAVGMVGGIVSAVTGVLSYLQGRRMEKDIGRIEVTTREIKADLANLRDDEWKRHETEGLWKDTLVSEVQRYGDAAGVVTSEILGTLQAANDILREIAHNIGNVDTQEGERETQTPNNNVPPDAPQVPVPALPPAPTPTPGTPEGTNQNTDAVNNNTEAVNNNTTAVTENVDAVTDAATAVDSLASTADDSKLTLADFVGRSIKDLDKFVKKQGSSLKFTTEMIDGAMEKVITDVKTGTRFIFDSFENKITRVLPALSDSLAGATGSVSEFSRSVDSVAGGVAGAAAVMQTATSDLNQVASAVRDAAAAMPAAFNQFTAAVRNPAFGGAGVTTGAGVLGGTSLPAGVAPAGAPIGSALVNSLTLAQPQSQNFGDNLLAPVVPIVPSSTQVTLNVNVANADSQKVANEIVMHTRAAGVEW